MEKSANYNFNLPNSANDEIADINDISDNFRIIDKIMNETDQTFKPTSTKAASGKAVNEAISGIQPIDENTEFIFDGGDVDGGVSVDIVVDTVLSKTSNNPIANKPVAIKFGEILEVIEQAKKDILLSAYPVGALFMSTANISPATLFGGTWERIKDTFLLASGDTYTAGATGGEATHTLTETELPEIDGEFATAVVGQHTNKGVKGHAYGTNFGTFTSGGVTGTDITNETQYGYGYKFGNGQPHNNMPPYLAVYVWKRTA